MNMMSCAYGGVSCHSLSPRNSNRDVMLMSLEH